MSKIHYERAGSEFIELLDYSLLPSNSGGFKLQSYEEQCESQLIRLLQGY